MAKKDKEQQYLALRSMFEGNHIKKMKDIEKLYPTMLAADMGMNHGRYINKLHNPGDFTFKQICKLASLLKVSPNLISEIIITELSARSKKASR